MIISVTAPQRPEGFNYPPYRPGQSYPPPHPAGYPPHPAGYPPHPGGYSAPPSLYPPMPYGVPGAAYGVDAYGRPLSNKSKVTAGLLQLFLGGFGAGRSYLGYPGIAIAQIAVTWLTFGAGGLWPFIDAIRMFTGEVRDAQGRTLRD
jgi:hypothetical protein